MKKPNFYIIIAAVVVFASIAIWLWQSQKATAPAIEINQPAINPAPAESSENTTSSISQELEGINVNDLDKEFQSIDNELENL